MLQILQSSLSKREWILEKMCETQTQRRNKSETSRAFYVINENTAEVTSENKSVSC